MEEQQPLATERLVETLRPLLAEFAGLRLALLFGSRARGDARPDSDLDLMIDGPAELVLPIASRVSEALEVEVDVTRISEVTIPLARQLLEEAVVVHEGAPGAAASFRTRTLIDLATDGPAYDRMRDAWLARVATRGLDGQ